jgi:hypothetical protein
MNVVFRCLLLTLLLATTESQVASAQFLKNLFGRDEPKPLRKPAPATPRPAKPMTPAAASPRKASAPPKPKPFEYPDTRRKPRYRVDVLVQLYLDELVQGTKSVYKVRIPEKAMPGMNFYEGIKLATDTLRDYYNLDIYIHDVTAAGKSPAQLTAGGTALDSSDLIIGAIPAAQLQPVAAFAKRRAINFVSALSPADGGVRDNPYFTLLQPTLQTHCEWIAKAVSRKYRSTKPVIIHRKSVAVDVSARRYLAGDDSGSYTILDASAAIRAGGLDAFLDQGSANVLLVTVLDAGMADSILQSVARNYPDYTFEVYGMPTWRSVTSFRKSGAFPNLAVNYTAPFYFDASTSSGQSVARAYQRAFGGKPGDMVYRAFETLHWYGYLLDRYGTVFNDNLADAGSAGFTRFDVRPRYDRDASLLYNENKHLYLYRFQGGNFTVEQ